MFFDDWSSVLRVVIVGAAAYVALIVMLRGAGKRALSKLNAFDLIVTIALGSVLASVLLSSSVALAEGLTAMALLLAMQYLVAWGSTHNRRVKQLVSSMPTLVYHRGFLHDAMDKERVTADELRQAARGQGYADLADVSAIVLETDGSLSILTAPPPVDSTS